MKFPEPRPIEDYCLGIFDGPHATPKEAGDGPVFLGIKNITDDGALDLSEIRHVSEEEYPRWTRRVTPQAGDVVFTYEATLHRYAIIPDGFRGCLGRRVALVRPDPDQVDSRYLHYFFLSRGWRRVIESNVITGATVDRIPLERFPFFPAALPGLRLQQQIADVLSAYDDLIENNRRRMVLLEEAARQLYREWFVRLRFPGHEHTRVANGVPEGWERKTIRELATVHRGKSYRSSELVETGGRPFANLKCVERFGGFRTSGLKQFAGDYKPHQVARPGDILVAVTDLTRDAMIVSRAARLPRLAGEEAVFSMDLVKVAPNDSIESEWLYMLLRFSSFADEVKEEASGTTVLHLKPKHIENWCALVPSRLHRQQFSLIVQNVLEQIDTLEVTNAGLRAARDLLLPRLMSGEVAV